MIRLILSGCNGRMGRVVEQICAGQPDLEIVAGIDLLGTGNHDFPVYSTPEECCSQADAVIDFSSPSALAGLLAMGTGRKIPLVLATTGYSEAQIEAIRKASEQIPLFRSANMSFGVNVLLELVRRAASALSDGYDIEIVERHHNKKLDAPSGTALMIADAAASVLPYAPEYVYQRHDVRQPRGVREIGISAVRGGGIVGDHEVIFAGRDEVIELRHSAMSREVFASGAVKAARYIASIQTPGLYSMTDLVNAVVQ